MKKIKIINQSKNTLPKYQTKGAAGMDLRANLENEIILKPMERTIIPTGLFLEIPSGYEVQIRPRSGLAIKHGITLINCVGTIDSDYRGEIGVPLVNLSQKNFIIKNGERIAQMILAKYEKINFEEVKILEKTERGTGGFGSTGEK